MARPPAPAWDSPLSRTSASLSRRPFHAGLCQDRRLARWRQHRRHGWTIGTRRALQIFLAEDNFSARQAHEWGLVARIVPAAELKAATRQFAERLSQNPPAAISGTKSLVYQAGVTSTRQQLDDEEKNIIAAMLTEDFAPPSRSSPARASETRPDARSSS